ncbi:pentapeptide repeat protein [Rippkaea orientalis PCC 8801]|uniref:Pentapeptide repeat protein n=1 Tax=Rippkaea orientalis (strain PCC 8801 / RF-1) TaxID=41431 RepID=B7JYG5_RIPO1|nr:pentapeptide repeat-containing protein [Rippkaea orientalis]ACK64835.1 pentapeptide repeat protein [Rippkaea orientalis PCC 8801]
MTFNFNQANLSGRSFKGQNLTGADFRCANIRGVNFANATLTGANFSHAKAGLSFYGLASLISIFVILAALSGLIAGYAETFIGLVVSLLSSSQERILARQILVIIGLLTSISFIVIIIRQGIGISLAILAIVFAVITAIIAYQYDYRVGADALIQFFVIAVIVASILLGALVQAIFLSITKKNRALILFAIPAVAGAIAGAIKGVKGIRQEFVSVSLIMAFIVSIGLLGLSVYIGIRAMAGDKKYDLVRAIANASCTAMGTSFRGANLTDADFTEAKLQNTDFRKAILKRTCWFQATNLDLAGVENTYLENPSLRQLVISKNGEGEFYDYQDLRGLNFKNANLVDASFIGADLSEATLQDADLSRAKLVQTRLYGSDLTHAILTGVCIQDWAISTDTQLQQVRCEYVYVRLPTKEDPDPWRKPDNRQETFREGDFSDFIAPIIKTLDLYRQQNIDPRKMASTFKTLDLYHYEGIDPSAAAITLKQLSEQYPDAGLEVVALEGRGDEKVRLQAVVTETVNQSQLSAEYFERYREISALPYKDIQALLAGMAEKDERIRSLERMVNSAIQGKKFYVETYYQMGDTVSEKSSINFTARDISGVVNLGSISGNVTNTINQLPESTDPNQPSLKELLTKLQAAIESETELPDKNKALALDQVKTLAELGQKPEDSALQKAAQLAIMALKGITSGLSETTKLVVECTKLLPAISTLLALV